MLKFMLTRFLDGNPKKQWNGNSGDSATEAISFIRSEPRCKFIPVQSLLSETCFFDGLFDLRIGVSFSCCGVLGVDFPLVWKSEGAS